MLRPLTILMVKAPRPGEVKTRLVPPLTAAAAASLASCFVRDTVTNTRRIIDNVLIAYAPADGRQTLESLVPEGLLWVEQHGEDLGARLEAAVTHAAGLGFGPLVVMGSDSPTVPARFLQAAIDSLASEASDIVLGPTEDGGYYLIGMRNCRPELFQDVEWSTRLTYKQTLRNAARLGLRALELPQWYDVDTFADLLRLRDEITSNEDARGLAVATDGWFKTHDSLVSQGSPLPNTHFP